jgi:SAM-dependent methyltransferase
MPSRDFERLVKSCYSSWSGDYYEQYYGKNAPYPPVHKDLIKKLLVDAGARRILDAGCGPASFLRELDGKVFDLYGFDLTPEMVSEARRIIAQKGVPPDHIWLGSVVSSESFRRPGRKRTFLFDAVVCVGVLPHIPEDTEGTVFENMRNAVKKNGLVVIEARNQLFSMFTLNRYSYYFFRDELIKEAGLKRRTGAEAAAFERAMRELKKMFRIDLPAERKGRKGNPGYDEVLSRTHNPIVLKDQFSRSGFKDIKLLFYHYHCLPPVMEKVVPSLFRKESLGMERPDDWRGYFMASAFLLAGRRK